MAGRWTVLDAPRLSTLLAWMNHACRVGALCVAPLSPDALPRISGRSLRSLVALCSSALTALVAMSRHHRLCSRLRARLSPQRRRVCATLRHCQARAPTLPPDYHLRQILSSAGYSPALNASDFSPRRRVTTLQRVRISIPARLRKAGLRQP